MRVITAFISNTIFIYSAATTLKILTLYRVRHCRYISFLQPSPQRSNIWKCLKHTFWTSFNSDVCILQNVSNFILCINIQRTLQYIYFFLFFYHSVLNWEVKQIWFYLSIWSFPWYTVWPDKHGSIFLVPRIKWSVQCTSLYTCTLDNSLFPWLQKNTAMFNWSLVHNTICSNMLTHTHQYVNRADYEILTH